MHLSKTALKFAATCAILSLATSASQASTVTAGISYDPLGLAQTDGLVPAGATLTDTAVAAVATYDLLPAGVNYGPYMRLSAASGNGSMDASTRLAAGGIAQATALWNDTIVNDSGASQSYQMNIALTGIGFGLGGWTGNINTRDFRAGYVANVLVNGVSVWNSSQTFSQTGSAINIAKSGFDIGDGVTTDNGSTNPYFSYSLNDYAGAIDLGTFGNGQSFNVSYSLSSSAYWNDPAGCAYECGRVEARISDPFGSSGASVVAAPVPEPEIYAMMLVGLGLIGAISRRRKQS